MSDENAKKGIAFFISDLATTYAFGVKKPSYKIYREIFGHQQDDLNPTDIFICRIRALFEQLPSAVPEDVQLDMTYGILSLRIRKRLSRDSIKTFDKLSSRARVIEETFVEEIQSKVKPKPKERQAKTHTNNKETSVSTTDIFSFDLEQFGEPPRPIDRPVLLIDLNGCVAYGLIDMRARQSVAGYQLCQMLLEKKQSFEQKEMSVILADGKIRSREVLYTTVNVRIQGHVVLTTFIEFLDSAKKSRTLLGIDFIKDAKIIDTGNHTPVSSNPYPVPNHNNKVFRKEIDEMLSSKVIEPCESPWALPVVLVPKNDNTWRVGRGMKKSPLSMQPAERNYDAAQREALAVVWACHKFRGYIEGNEVEIASNRLQKDWPDGHSLSISLQLPHHGTNEIREKQLEDPDVRKIIECFEGRSGTPDIANWLVGYLMNNGILYRSQPDKLDVAQLVIPKKERQNDLKLGIMQSLEVSTLHAGIGDDGGNGKLSGTTPGSALYVKTGREKHKKEAALHCV
ncbi:hypothetical protein ILUMI_12051 [Ignelater luminosus]|uniref:Reverse transcriptase RNase H-like domain-containing protein n=1 Tax=Ignelater luminosus TaxID=2038154 RepID=A0A8K0GCP0_IGNLU|nr:hypothetical protein ILUMI_12051 [Ignelater luminosus]